MVIWVFRKRNDGPSRFEFEDLLLRAVTMTDATK